MNVVLSIVEESFASTISGKEWEAEVVSAVSQNSEGEDSNDGDDSIQSNLVETFGNVSSVACGSVDIPSGGRFSTPDVTVVEASSNSRLFEEGLRARDSSAKEPKTITNVCIEAITSPDSPGLPRCVSGYSEEPVSKRSMVSMTGYIAEDDPPSERPSFAEPSKRRVSFKSSETKGGNKNVVNSIQRLRKLRSLIAGLESECTEIYDSLLADALTLPSLSAPEQPTHHTSGADD